MSRSAVRKFHCSTPAKFSYNLQIPICLNCTQGDSVNYYPSFLEDKRYVYFCLSFVKCREMCGSWLNICMWHIHQKQHLGLRDQEENQICCQSLEVLARAYGNQLNVIDYLHQRICLFCNFQFLKPRPIWRARFTGLPWPHCTPWWCKTSVNLNWLGLLGLAPCRVYSCFTLPEQCRKSKQTGLSLAAVRHRAGQLRIRATGRKQTLFLVGKNNYIRVVQEKIITVVCNFREGKAS